MLFGLEKDTGPQLVWYVVPDGYGDIAKAVVFGNGQKLITLAANEVRSALVDAGRHPTGMCGFALDDATLPGLANIYDLEIRDAATDILIYRRAKDTDVKQKLIHIYPEIFPPRAFISQLDPLFQYSGIRLEIHGHETVTQFFHIRDCDSMFFSGRFLFDNYANWIEDRLRPLIFINDPYVVLAERILVLSKLNQVGRPELVLGERDAMLFKPAMDYIQTIDLQNTRDVKQPLSISPKMSRLHWRILQHGSSHALRPSKCREPVPLRRASTFSLAARS